MTGDFHFLRPMWLLGIPAALILWWVVTRRDDPRRRWRGVIADHLLDHLLVAPGARNRVRPIHLTSLALMIASISAAGPAWRRELPPLLEDRAPLVVAIDVSETMNAIDVTPTRLERAKLEVRDLLALRAGARTAVVAYAGSAHVVLPLTDDASLITTYVDALDPAVMPVKGRDTVLALNAVERVLANEDTPGTVLFLTDGLEDAAYDRLTAAMRDGRLQPIVLGIGTAEGGPVKTANGDYATDASGARLFARLDVDAFRRLHDRTGVPVATITTGESDVEWVQRRVQSHLQARQSEMNARWKDDGWFLVIPLVAMGAWWFRKGWTIRWSTAAFVMMLGLPAPAAAQEWRFADLWLTKDQQGQLAFNRGDFVTAAERYADPFRKGVALYRAGRFDDAVKTLALVNTPESDYNQGNALARLGRYPDAVARYEAALKRRPDFPAAAANLAIVKALIPPPKKDDEQQAFDPNQKADKLVFDDKGKKGKAGQVDSGGEQTAELWMRNIQTTPAGLLRRKFAIEAERKK